MEVRSKVVPPFSFFFSFTRTFFRQPLHNNNLFRHLRKLFHWESWLSKMFRRWSWYSTHRLFSPVLLQQLRSSPRNNSKDKGLIFADSLTFDKRLGFGGDLASSRWWRNGVVAFYTCSLSAATFFLLIHASRHGRNNILNNLTLVFLRSSFLSLPHGLQQSLL